MPLYKINIYAFFLIGFLNPLARAEGNFFRYVCLSLMRFINYLARNGRRKNVQFAMILPPSPSSMLILKRGSSRLWGRMCDIDVEGAKSKKGNAIFETNFLSHIFFEFLVFVAIVGKISSSSSQSRRKNSKIH